MAELLKGAAVSKSIKEKLAEKIKELSDKGFPPKLAIMRIGEKPDDMSYQASANKNLSAVGIEVVNFNLPADIETSRVLDVINEINMDESISGALLLRPFPKHLDDTLICNSLFVSKDMDGITDMSMAAIYSGLSYSSLPCTAEACVEILDHYGIDVKGKNCVIIGRSLVIGKPVALRLLSKNATVTICHSKTENLREICKRADILIAAIGRAEFVDASFVSEGQVVVDVGINVNEEGKLLGDVKFDEVSEKVAAITPVPGGVGSVTTAVLAKHVVAAQEKKISIVGN